MFCVHLAYLRAMDLQATLSSQPLPIGSEAHWLPMELYALILRRLPLNQVQKEFMGRGGGKKSSIASFKENLKF